MDIKRSIFNNLVDQISRPQVSVILGPRQVGKTFLMQKLKDFCVSQGYATIYYNLELPSDLRELTGTEDEVYRKLTKQAQVIFIDEMHYLENASKIFKAIYDSRKDIKIFASGSSAIEMHKHLKESLAGRIWKNKIYPLSCDELKQLPDYTLEHALVFGGLPGLVHEYSDMDKTKYLEMVLETYITKDIKSLIKEENIRAFNHMLYFLAHHQGSILPFSSISKEVGLTEPTIKHHLEILNQTYVCHPLESFARNLSNELKKSKKYYFYDLGIRNLLIKDMRSYGQRQDEDRGVIGETFIFLNLYSQLKPNMEIRFWRTRNDDEIDFIVLKNRIPYPIEVKTSLGKAYVPNSMKTFFSAYPESPEGYIFCRDIEEILIFKDKKIFICPWEKSLNFPLLQNIT